MIVTSGVAKVGPRPYQLDEKRGKGSSYKVRCYDSARLTAVHLLLPRGLIQFKYYMSLQKICSYFDYLAELQMSEYVW